MMELLILIAMHRSTFELYNRLGLIWKWEWWSKYCSRSNTDTECTSAWHTTVISRWAYFACISTASFSVSKYWKCPEYLSIRVQHNDKTKCIVFHFSLVLSPKSSAPLFSPDTKNTWWHIHYPCLFVWMHFSYCKCLEFCNTVVFALNKNRISILL